MDLNAAVAGFSAVILLGTRLVEGGGMSNISNIHIKQIRYLYI